jgi:hypothetical protein
MRFKHALNEAWKLVLVLTIISSLVLAACPIAMLVSAVPDGVYNYMFIVDREGFTMVNINYTTTEVSGSSWVLVPKYSGWLNHTIRGTVTGEETTGWVVNVSGEIENDTFYDVLHFSFKSDNAEFEMNIQYNISVGAMIIEPDGIFYSSQIGFELGSKLEATVFFPQDFRINSNEASAYGNSTSYSPSSITSRRVVFDNIPDTENMIRIEIGFNTPDQSEPVEITNGIFTFETVSRYAQYARPILDLYNRTYSDLVDLFNVTLDRTNVHFFIPDFSSLLTEGGYTPFTANSMGDVYISIFSTRFMEGFVEVIALHELVHHFLWKAGISPSGLLWFHEGMSQYVSMEVANNLGYEGAGEMIREMEQSVSQLGHMVGGDWGFIQAWSPTNEPQDLGDYYTAAYHVVESLAEGHGGLDYYAHFFRIMHGETIATNTELSYYLSLTSNESVATSLNSWGFSVPDLYMYSALLGNVKKVIDEVNPLYQPYKYLAELLYDQALSNARPDSVSELNLYLTAAIIVAKLAPLLTLITIAGVLFGAILLVLRSRGVFWNY